MKYFRVLLLAAVIQLVVTGVVIAAEDYPTKPVRMIVPFGPGGSVDFVARIISPGLSKELGQQVVVDNRTGASGNIGVEVAAHAKPDGYTILIGNNNTIAINPPLFPKFPIKPVRDFIAVSEVGDLPGALVVNPSVPVRTLKEFIEYVKARPGKLNYGSSGAGATMRLAMEYFMHEAGLTIVHVPYKGGTGASTTGVVGGEVNALCANLASVLPHIKSGKLVVLAVVAPKRLAVLPDTPTMAESGFPKMTAGTWHGVYVPVGTPKPVVNRLFNAVVKTMADPEVIKRFADVGADAVVSKSPEEFTKFTQSETDFYAKIIKTIGLIGE
jgi:tripartite-type tricarboxylate transporter receptor subunit TctC